MPCYFIAEAGVNHNGSLERAEELVRIARQAGADAVKFQTFSADKLVNKTAGKAPYQKWGDNDHQTQHELLSTLELTAEDFKALYRLCRQLGIDFISTPFDLDSLDLLVSEIAVDRLKIGSGDLTNAPLLHAAARSGLPIILSSGMASMGEIEQALGVVGLGLTSPDTAPVPDAAMDALSSTEVQTALRNKVSLLQCTSLYPTADDQLNLNTIPSLRAAFDLEIGFSDHSIDGFAAPLAVAMGATIVEKHFTQDKALPGPDHKASLEPDELAALIASVRRVDAVTGSGRKVPLPGERANRAIARKGLKASGAIKEGDPIREADLVSLRPETGASPFQYWTIVGSRADRDYEAGDPVSAPADT